MYLFDYLGQESSWPELERKVEAGLDQYFVALTVGAVVGGLGGFLAAEKIGAVVGGVGGILVAHHLTKTPDNSAT